MNDDFSKYEAMKSAGDPPEALERAANSDGLDTPARIRMLRALFGLSFPAAKEIMLRAEGAESLDAHQDRIARELDED